MHPGERSMQNKLSLGAYSRSLMGASLLLSCSVAAFGADTYDPSTRRLSIASVRIGSALYTGMVVTIAGVVSGPSGIAPIGSEDRYDPVTRQLTVPAVMVGAAAYDNVVLAVEGLVSIAGVTGADSYGGTDLSISYVQVLGGPTYGNAVVSVGGIVSVGGAMPALGWDSYDPAGHRLTSPAVQVGSRIYTNVIVTVGAVVSLPGVTAQKALIMPPASQSLALTEGSCGAPDYSGTQTVPWYGLLAATNPANPGALSVPLIMVNGAWQPATASWTGPALMYDLSPYGPPLYGNASTLSQWTSSLSPDGVLTTTMTSLAATGSSRGLAYFRADALETLSLGTAAYTQTNASAFSVLAGPSRDCTQSQSATLDATVPVALLPLP